MNQRNLRRNHHFVTYSTYESLIWLSLRGCIIPFKTLDCAHSCDIEGARLTNTTLEYPIKIPTHIGCDFLMRKTNLLHGTHQMD
jgi:hypothetical protein